ncbi:MAG: hypothetical protein Q8P18_02180 [Pseudomonadota bacterium]|nr:hypothetical protein [Pseudomonadota bacterium]
MRAALPLLALLLSACPPSDGVTPDDKDADDTGDTVEGRTFEDFVNVTTPWVGNTDECIAGKVQNVDPSCIADITVNGRIDDFQSEDPVPDATVQLWVSDSIEGAADETTVSDGDGNFVLEAAQSCTPIAYGTSTPPEWEETKDTYEVHQVFGYAAGGASDEVFNSVSDTTSKLIPSLIGVEWDQSTGIIAGTAYDCDVNPVEYAQVFIHDGSGGIPTTGDVFYFSESGGTSLPTSLDSQPHTNTNGLWVAVNIPSGTWTAEMWGFDGTDYVLMGATVLEIAAGSVNISNIYTGISDGIWYPGSCLAACAG